MALKFEYQGQVTETVEVNKEVKSAKTWVESLKDPTDTGVCLGKISKSIGKSEIPADIMVGAESLINTGNYENVKLLVQIRVPCPGDMIDETYGLACAWISDRMAGLLKHAKGED